MINRIINIFIIVMLLIISFIDIKKKIIPDWILAIGFLVNILFSKIFIDNIIGCIIGFSVFLIIALTTDAIGGGDIKLMALIGFIFGVKGVLFTIFFSFAFGAIISVMLLLLRIKEKKDTIAFGPFISSAALIYMFWGSKIIELYISIYVCHLL